MKKKKKLKPKAKKPKKKLDPNIQEIYWDTITFYCHIKKKMITQKVQVKKYKSLSDIARINRALVATTDPLEGIDSDDDLTIYGTTEEPSDDE